MPLYFVLKVKKAFFDANCTHIKEVLDFIINIYTCIFKLSAI